MKRLLVSAAALALSAGALHAQTLTAVLNADMRSSNPGVNRDDNTDTVMLHFVEGLVGYAEDGSVGPLLAEKVDVSADGKTYTFTLRKGVKFHNGAEMTSADVLWSWNRYMDPKTDWRCLSDLDGRNGLKVVSATAPDAGTFVMELNAPNALFLDTLARTDCAGTAVIHKDSVKADGSWDKPIGTGPFKLGEWKRGQSIQLIAFDQYASPKGDKRDGLIGSKRPLVKEARFMVIPDAATVKAGLMAGSLDIASVPESDVADLKPSRNLAIEIGTNPVRHSLIIQTRDPLMKNQALRQAIAAAIDFPELVGNVSNGLGKPNNSPIYLTSKFYGEAEKQGFKYDPAAAKALLQKAGYKGEKITILANKRSSVPSFNTAVIAQAMMQAAGINAEIEVLEWATQLDRYNKGNYQMQAFSYSGRFDPALGFEQISGPKDKQPRKVWEDPEALALIDKSMVVTDPAERQKIFDELHKRFVEQVPSIFTHNDIDIVAHGKRITGVTPWMSKLRLWEVAAAK
ncbi:Peptide ABC transporter substrate-binding protein [Hyphomicrobiales bacterium]|nr:Peptide ABC transporter substrate-binding protein [Hyphomicrobiales bacterium]CAH1698445.1 Peptide ABC transporter substrate-binding protein [Hyphomicrobiales bacterium]CAI0342095.1 peptide/nickel transport system substrate-binding protein [Hyphomicrobiales bacterium]